MIDDMTINGKVHCFFEQSGTFKCEFIKLGIPAEDYDIQNNFGETDHVIPWPICADRFYDRTNLQSLCDECNNIKGQKDKKLIQSHNGKVHQ